MSANGTPETAPPEFGKLMGTVTFEFYENASRHRMDGHVPVAPLVYELETLKQGVIARQAQLKAIEEARRRQRQPGLILPGELPPGALPPGLDGRGRGG